jgi:hypothetical protein
LNLAENVKEKKFGYYSDVIRDTCNFMRSSIDNEVPYVIRIQTLYKKYEIQIDELDRKLRELFRRAFISIQLVKGNSVIEKTVTIWITEEEWDNGGLQECGSCFDTCRCCDSHD